MQLWPSRVGFLAASRTDSRLTQSGALPIVRWRITKRVFRYLVGAAEQRWWDGKVERFGSFEICLHPRTRPTLAPESRPPSDFLPASLEFVSGSWLTSPAVPPYNRDRRA